MRFLDRVNITRQQYLLRLQSLYSHHNSQNEGIINSQKSIVVTTLTESNQT